MLILGIILWAFDAILLHCFLYHFPEQFTPIDVVLINTHFSVSQMYSPFASNVLILIFSMSGISVTSVPKTTTLTTSSKSMRLYAPLKYLLFFFSIFWLLLFPFLQLQIFLSTIPLLLSLIPCEPFWHFFIPFCRSHLLAKNHLAYNLLLFSPTKP